MAEDESPEWDGTNYGPTAPHWHHFKECARGAWAFEFLDTGLAAVEDAAHRFRITTRLLDGDRGGTYRVWQITYEPADADPTAEDVASRVPLYHGPGSDAIPRNNLFAARMSLADGEEHVVVIMESDNEEGIRVPSETIAEMAADEYTRIGMDTHRDISAIVQTVERWERKQELKQSLSEVDQTDG